MQAMNSHFLQVPLCDLTDYHLQKGGYAGELLAGTISNIKKGE